MKYISGTIGSEAHAFSPNSFTVTATDSAASVSDSKSVSWTVNPAYLDVVQGDQDNAAGEAVTADLESIYVSGHTVSYSASGLPSGLSINSSSGGYFGNHLL